MKKSPVVMNDLYFMDARSKLIDIAAFMDRVERAGETGDYRYQGFIKTLSALSSPSNRAETILKALSDPSETPCEKAGSPAAGAFKEN